jgi:hypothetical protein
MPRATSSTSSRPPTPDFLTTPILADMVAGHLGDLADQNEQHSVAAGMSRVAAAEVRMLRRAAEQVRAFGTGEKDPDAPPSGARFPSFGPDRADDEAEGVES